MILPPLVFSAPCHVIQIATLSVIMLNVIVMDVARLSVIMPGVVMLNVAAPGNLLKSVHIFQLEQTLSL